MRIIMKQIKDIIRCMRVYIVRSLMFRKGDFPLEEGTLILAPHPDDEIIGCGGLIIRLVEQGYMPTVIILSGGGKSHEGCCTMDEETLISERRWLTLRAADIVGLPYEHIYFLNFKDGSISEDDKANMEKLREIVSKINPRMILVPHSGEGWSDHLATRRIGLALVNSETEVWEYCVWMWYYNVWTISYHIARLLRMDRHEHRRKLAAIDAYTKALAPCGKPWSGVLPRVFLWANKWKKELYFRVK